MLATPVWLTGRWDGLEMGGLKDEETQKLVCRKTLGEKRS